MKTPPIDDNLSRWSWARDVAVRVFSFPPTDSRGSKSSLLPHKRFQGTIAIYPTPVNLVGVVITLALLILPPRAFVNAHKLGFFLRRSAFFLLSLRRPFSLLRTLLRPF